MKRARSTPSDAPRRGFTLLEVLAVVILFSLVASVLTVHLAAASESATFRAAASRLRDMDARARLFARTSGPLVLSLQDQGRSLLLSQVDTGASLLRVDLGEGAAVEIETDPPRRWILFDRSGRSVDYELALASGEREARWQVAGTTGWMQPADEEQGK